MKTEPEVWMVVLAAGFSRRMGSQKLLLPVGSEGLLRKSVKNVLSVDVAGVSVILNPDFKYLEKEISDLPVYVRWNDAAAEGMSTSLRTGISSLPPSADAAGIVLADQPDLQPEIISKLINDYKGEGAMITQANYQGTPSHPVIFDRKLFPQLLNQTGDTGGKKIINQYKEFRRLINFSCPAPEDIDTREDYERIVLKREVR